MQQTDNTIALMLKRLFLLASFTLIGILLTSVVLAFLPEDAGVSTRLMRVITVVQDIFVFIVPAIALALMCSRDAAGFLSIERAPAIWPAVVAVATLIVSAPVQDAIIHWNEGLTLPESLAGLEKAMADAEAAAQQATQTIMGGTTAADLILGILITGAFAALSEELYFRGALQRLLAGTRKYSHASVWIAATLFSLFHLQFYGFVPRLLLGVYFGYLVWWTRSLWVPVIVHACNNSVVVASEWMARRAGEETALDAAGDSVWLVAGSAVLTVAGIVCLYRMTHATANNDALSQSH